ncbi:MAG: hypothetical protein MR364_07490 [Oscillospiraceae bacterium]|nr:hypothetical protein [Oscillospiraceae bacterium]
MSMKKILAAASASVLAVSAVSVMASADATKYTVDYVESWTDFKLVDEKDVAGSVATNLGADVDLKSVKSITVTSHGVTKWQWGYNNTVDGWSQCPDDAPLGDGDTYTFENIDVEKEDLCIKMGVTTADDGAYFDVEVKTADAEAPAESAPAESTPAADNTTSDATKPNPDSGVEGVAAVLGVAVVAAGAMVVAKKRK